MENSLQINSELWKDLFEQTFDHSIIGMAILSDQGIFIKVNKKMCEIMERSSEELIGKSWVDITHPDDLSKSTHYVQSYKDKPKEFSISIEKRYITGRGRIIHCRISSSRVFDSTNGKMVYFITQIEDITTLHEIKQSIMDERNYIHGLLNKNT